MRFVDSPDGLLSGSANFPFLLAFPYSVGFAMFLSSAHFGVVCLNTMLFVTVVKQKVLPGDQVIRIQRLKGKRSWVCGMPSMYGILFKDYSDAYNTYMDIILLCYVCSLSPVRRPCVMDIILCIY